MSEVVAERGISAAPAPVASLGELMPYALFAGVVALVLLYLVGAEEGATSLFSSHYVHELVHDGRHLLGFPCH